MADVVNAQPGADANACFDLKLAHPVTQPCCGATKVDNVIWTEDRDQVPEFLKAKGVSLELWQETHDDTVAHFKTYYNCCNAFWLNIFFFIVTYGLAACIMCCQRSNFESGWINVLRKHSEAYKECGIKMEIAMEKDSTFESITSCGNCDKTVGLRFLLTSHVQTV